LLLDHIHTSNAPNILIKFTVAKPSLDDVNPGLGREDNVIKN